VESKDGVGLGVTLEVGSARVKPFVKDEVERRKIIVGYVTRGGDPKMALE